jgi:phosphoribosylanthranilate isomerase
MPRDRPVLKVCGITRVADMRWAEHAGADFCGFITEIERSPRCLTREQAALLARGCRVGRVLVVEKMSPEEIAGLAESIVRTGASAPQEIAIQLHGGDADYIRKVVQAVGRGPAPRHVVPFGGAGLRSRPGSVANDDTPASALNHEDTRPPQGTHEDAGGAAALGRERSPAPPNGWTTSVAVEIWRPIGLPEHADDRDALVAETLAEIDAALKAGASAIVLDTRTSEGTGGSGRTCDWEAAAKIVRRTEAPVLLAGGLSPENLREALQATGAAGADLSSSLEAAPGWKSPARLRALEVAWRAVAQSYGAEGL